MNSSRLATSAAPPTLTPWFEGFLKELAAGHEPDPADLDRGIGPFEIAARRLDPIWPPRPKVRPFRIRNGRRLIGF